MAETATQNMRDTIFALIGIEWPPFRGESPDTTTALDLIDFLGQRVALPIQQAFHSYYGHHELTFDVNAGRAQFRHEVNMIFARTGVAFEVDENMRTARLGPPEARQVLADLRPDTGDSTLDHLVIEARLRYMSRSPADERIGLERLWDAFERLKTIEPGADKKAKVTALLDRAASGTMRQVLEDESSALTKIGNLMQIRHFEIGKTALTDGDVDYLFARMSTLVVHVLRSTGRLAT